MLFSTVLVSSLAAAGAHAATIDNSKRQWDGKCTIGIKHWNNFVPGGDPASGAGENVHTDGSLVFIVGTSNTVLKGSWRDILLTLKRLRLRQCRDAL